MIDRPPTIDAFLGLPRLSDLRLSPDGSKLVVKTEYVPKGTKRFASALYEIDPMGESPCRRLTHLASRESKAIFAPNGSLLFTSAFPESRLADVDPHDNKPALWKMPAGGGEPHLLAKPPGGIEAIAVAHEAGMLVLASNSYSNSGSWEEDAKREDARRVAGIKAMLFTEYPIRFWDQYLGPGERHLYVIPLLDDGISAGAVQDLLPFPGTSLNATEFLNSSSFVITPNGATVVANRWRDDKSRQRFLELVAIDNASGKTWTLAEDDASYKDLVCSPDGRWIAAVRQGRCTPDYVADTTLCLIEIETGHKRNVLEGFDRWPMNPVWAPSSSAVFFTADDEGHSPIFRVDTTSGLVTQLAGSGAYSDLCPSPDGRTLFALRSTISDPPHPVALDLYTEVVTPRRLPSFEELDGLELETRVKRVSTVAKDGTPVQSWLVLPPEASVEIPAPLATCIHGGPLDSWNSWHWRWNPHVLAEAGWAVLLPDPALSTGYGLGYIRRGWGRWGDVVYGDIMSAVDSALRRGEIDSECAVAMGGSFGGYMVNWIAGHVDRFRALVAHAGKWDLESFHGTTDMGWWWEQQLGDPYEDGSRYHENSPRPSVKSIDTPMLITHGARDYRVAVSEAIRAWTDLKRNGVRATFLYFPDEGHWITKPNNIRIWYETILRFLDQHARGQEWKKPDLL